MKRDSNHLHKDTIISPQTKYIENKYKKEEKKNKMKEY